jgi:hypothetical protein
MPPPEFSTWVEDTRSHGDDTLESVHRECRGRQAFHVPAKKAGQPQWLLLLDWESLEAPVRPPIIGLLFWGVLAPI